MEAAPLTLAHTHARNAVLETRKSNPVAASEEHDLAAGEFATAAQSSSDQEALRTLHLLENHHKQLAEILRFQHEHPASTTAETSSTAVAPPNISTLPSSTVHGVGKAIGLSQDSQNQTRKLPGHARSLSRETSSIASGLASARGIPSHPRRGSPVSPTLSSQQAGAKMSELPSTLKTGESKLRDMPSQGRPSRASASRQPWSPPMASPTEGTSQQVMPPHASEPGTSKDRTVVIEEPFQRFYSTFEGLISKISAPLAFAGLPLGSENPEQVESASRKAAAETRLDRNHATPERPSVLAEPDVNRLFSRAALRSIRDTAETSPGNTSESFYVVPTTGGTMSYAGILTRAEKEARRNSLEDGDDDFVDARETPASPEMRQSLGAANSRSLRRGAADKLTSLQNPKTLEELQMENQALKHLSDTLSKRLHMWEVNAQSSSMALQQSLKAMHHISAGAPDQVLAQGASAATSPVAQLSTEGPTPIVADTDSRVKELENLVRRGEQDLERVGRENEKLRNVLGRYRDRWEKLKEGAKTRRAEGRLAGDSQGSTPQTPVDAAAKPEAPVSPQPDKEPGDSKSTRGAVDDAPVPEPKVKMDIADT